MAIANRSWIGVRNAKRRLVPAELGVDQPGSITEMPLMKVRGIFLLVASW